VDGTFVAAAFVAPILLVTGLAVGSFSYRYFPLVENPLPGMSSAWWWGLFALLSVPLLLETIWQR
jgi:hypothetical protein